MTFESLLGQNTSRFQHTCVLAPFLTKGLIEDLGVKDFIKGHPFSFGNGRSLTLIHTGIGAAYAGDAVLSLQDSPAENLILLGACGSVQDSPPLAFGSLVMPSQSYALESFSRLLQKDHQAYPVSEADQTLLARFQTHSRHEDIPVVKCATFGSILLEQEYRDYLIQEKIAVMDMESSAFFSAARYIQRKAIALFYITDTLQGRHAFQPLSPDEKNRINTSIKKACGLILDFSANSSW